MMAAKAASSGRPAACLPRAPEGMAGAPVATLLLAQTEPPLARRRPRRPPQAPGPLALHCTSVPFSLGSEGLSVFSRAGGTVPVPTGPVGFPYGLAPGATLSASGNRLAADRLPEIRVVSPLPRDAQTVTIQPHAGSAVLAISVRDANGLHPVPLRCVNLLSGWWKIGADRLGRSCWQSGEAVLRLPPLQGAATVELTLVAI
jgi:hypothetical protein